MLIAKVSAVVAAVLFMSSVSAQAMEFADRPGITVANSAIEVASVRDLARRQINQPESLWGTDERTRAILESIFKLLAEPQGPGRLSAEFSPVVVDSGKFEHRPIMIGSRIKVVTRRVGMRFEDRPGPATGRLNTLTAVTSKLLDRIVTSSVRKSKAPFGLHTRPSAAEFCVGSIAPCGSLNFAQRPVKQDS
jgi:hypothetical protein